MQIETILIPGVFTNCYVVSDQPGGQAVVVDPGGGGAYTIGKIKAVLEASGVALSAILLTHGHYDHVEALPDLRKEYPAIPLYLHPLDAGQNDESLFPSAGLDGFLPLSEGQRIQVGALAFQVLHTPGHTPGSVCFLCEEEGVLLTGDTLFRGSCGRTDFPGGDWEEMMASLRRLAGLKGDCQVFPGHEGSTTLERERRRNPFVLAAVEGRA